jgi:uncharacterized protein YfaS (alpha-2-macroglobulin family)
MSGTFSRAFSSAFAIGPTAFRPSATLASVGQLFGLLQLAGGTDVIDLIGPMSVLAGDDVTYRLTVTDDTGARIDLTAATALEVQVKPALGAPDPPTISKSLAAATITLLDQTSTTTRGQADFTFSSADTNVTSGLYWIDIVLVLGGKRTHVVAPREYTIAATVNGP